MGIGWCILGYLVIGVCFAIWYAKWGKGTGSHCVGLIYGWPFIMAIGLFIVWPQEYFEKVIENVKAEKRKKEEEERLKKTEKLAANCEKCGMPYCPTWTRPYSETCYERPYEEKRD